MKLFTIAIWLGLLTYVFWPRDTVNKDCAICGGASPGYGSPR